MVKLQLVGTVIATPRAHGSVAEFPKTLGSPHPFSIEHHHDHEHQPADHPHYELDPTNLERMFEGVEDTAVHAYRRRHSFQAAHLPLAHGPDGGPPSGGSSAQLGDFENVTHSRHTSKDLAVPPRRGALAVRPSLLSGDADRQLEALLSSTPRQWRKSTAATDRLLRPRRSFLAEGPTEGLEPAELLTGLCPRHDKPGLETITTGDLREVDTVIFDCDGLVLNVQETDLKKSSSAYAMENVHIINAILGAGKNVIFADSGHREPSRAAFRKQLKDRGVHSEDAAELQVCLPVDAAVWYIRSQGFQKPLVVSSQVSLFEEVRLAFPSCLCLMDKDGHLRPEFRPGAIHSPSDEEVAVALAAVHGADCVVLGTLAEDLPALAAAAVSTVLGTDDANPRLVVVAGQQARRKLKSARSSVTCQKILAGAGDSQEFVDMTWPSRLLSAAMFAQFAVEPSKKTLVIGRSLHRSARFAYRSGASSLLVLDNLTAQLNLTKEQRHEYLPDWVLPSLGELLEREDK
ncbi:Aldh3a1 [Symbiodinium sp. CCMP2592]|nr:Aldh3a1 [Symbiodinium sp. CCMP2592]